MSYYEKYLKYKKKYMDLFDQVGRGYNEPGISEYILSIGFEFEFGQSKIMPIKFLNEENGIYNLIGLDYYESNKFNNNIYLQKLNGQEVENIKITLDTAAENCKYPQTINQCVGLINTTQYNNILILLPHQDPTPLYEEITLNPKKLKGGSNTRSMKRKNMLNAKYLIYNKPNEAKDNYFSNLEYIYTVYDINEYKTEIEKRKQEKKQLIDEDKIKPIWGLGPKLRELDKLINNFNIFFYYYAKFLQIINQHFQKYTAIPLDTNSSVIRANDIENVDVKKKFNEAVIKLQQYGQIYLPKHLVKQNQTNGTSTTTYAYIDKVKKENFLKQMKNAEGKNLTSNSVYSVPFFCQVTVKLKIQNINSFIKALLKDLNASELAKYTSCEGIITGLLNSSGTFNLLDVTSKQILISYFTFNLYDRFIMIEKAYALIADKELERNDKLIKLEEIDGKIGSGTNIRNDFALRHLEKDVIQNINQIIGQENFQLICTQICSNPDEFIQHPDQFIRLISDINFSDYSNSISFLKDYIMLKPNLRTLERNNLGIYTLQVSPHEVKYYIGVNKSLFFKVSNFADTFTVERGERINTSDVQIAEIYDQRTQIGLKRSQVKYFNFTPDYKSAQVDEVLIELRGIGQDLNNKIYQDQIKIHYDYLKTYSDFSNFSQEDDETKVLPSIVIPENTLNFMDTERGRVIARAVRSQTNTNTGANSFNSGANSFNSGANSFNPAANSFNSGVNSFNSGVNSFNPAANSFNSGVNSFNSGANPFNSGANPFNSGANPFNSGANPFNPNPTSQQTNKTNTGRGKNSKLIESL